MKENYSRDVYEATFMNCFKAVWERNENMGELPILKTVLGRTLEAEDVDKVIAASEDKAWKDKLSQNTKEALDQGAYGNPWFWVRNAKGEEGPFFGSDRWPYMWEFLDLKWKDIEVETIGASKM